MRRPILTRRQRDRQIRELREAAVQADLATARARSTISMLNLTIDSLRDQLDTAAADRDLARQEANELRSYVDHLEAENKALGVELTAAEAAKKYLERQVHAAGGWR